LYAAGRPQCSPSSSVEQPCQLGADEDEAAFKAKLAQIARQKVKDAPEPEVEEVK